MINAGPPAYCAPMHLGRELGLTLVELLVAMALMGVVTLATIALYNTSAATYRTVDANQEMQSRARYAMEVLTQSIRVAGYQDLTGRNGGRSDPTNSSFARQVFAPNGIIPAVRGYNNSNVPAGSTNSLDFDGATGADNGVNASDTLAIRFFGSGLDSTGAADGSIVDCRGRTHGYPAGTTWGDIPVSLFTVDIANGEPELRCIGLGSTSGTRLRDSIVRGVESFQVVYAVDQVLDDANVPESWLSAEAITTAAAWSQVRWVRVGLILRGEPGTAQAQGPDLYPLGKDFIGSRTDAGLRFTPPNDGRLRRAFTTTIQLRNPQ